MSQASYNLVTSAPMLIHDLVQFQLVYVHDSLLSLLLYSNIKVYHDGAAMTPSAVDAILSLTRMQNTTKIADDAPFTSNQLKGSDCGC